MEGTADRPPDPPTFAKGHILTEKEEAKVDNAEESLEKYLSRDGQVKTQIILSVSESLALMLQKQKTAKDTWDALVTEMIKKPLGRNCKGLVGYVDANWAPQGHRHSISTFIFQIDGGSIS